MPTSTDLLKTFQGGLLASPLVKRAMAGLAPGDPAVLTLGEGEDGQEASLSYAARERGVLVQGSSGYGKTRLLVALALGDILTGRTGMLLDPVGTTGQLLLEYLGALSAALEMARQSAKGRFARSYYRQLQARLQRRVHILDLSNAHQTHRINLCAPLPGLGASETVEAIIMPILKKELGDMHEARRLLMVLRAALVPVVEAGGCLADVLDILSVFSKADSVMDLCKELDRRHHRLARRPGILRRYLTELFLMLPKSERLVHTQSAWHALGQILAHPTCERLFGSLETTFDVGKIIDGGGYMIVVVPQREGAASPVVSSALMGLITQACLQRDLRAVQTGQRPEVFLTIDEFHLALGRDRSIHDLVATCRNIGLRMCVAFQHERQGDLGSDPDLVANWRANTATHIYFRCALDSARSFIAEHVHRPQGQRIKRRYEQRTLTRSQSRSQTLTVQVGEAVSIARTEGSTQTVTSSDGQQISITTTNGTTVVESEGFSVAEGESFQSAQGRSFSFARSNGQSEVNGQAVGTSTGHSRGEIKGSSRSVGSGHAQSHQPMGMLPGLEGQSALPAMRESDSHSSSHTTSSSQAEQFSSSISNVVSQAQAVSWSESQSQGYSESEGRSRSHQQARVNALARGISEAKALATGLTRTVGHSEGLTESVSVTRSQNYSRAVATQHGLTDGESVRVVEDLYTLDEEVRLLAYEVASLPRQHALMISDQPDGQRITCRMRVKDVPDVGVVVGQVDGLALLRRRCAGPHTPPARPRRSLFERFSKGVGDA